MSSKPVSRVLLPVFLILIILGAVLLRDKYVLHLLILSGIYAIAVSGLNLLSGYMGLLNLGHPAFFGIGAYTAALLYLRYHVQLPLGLPLAGLVAAAFGFVLGYIILRIRGVRFILVSLAFLQIVELVSFNWVSLTNGQLGLGGILPPNLQLGSLEINFLSKNTFLVLVVLITILVVAVIKRLIDSKLGRALVALRQNEGLGQSLGISAFGYAMLAFVLGSFLGGIAGGLYVYYIGFISPAVFAFYQTVIMLVMLIMGGMGTLWGPILGAIIFTLLPEYLRAAEAYRMLVFGLIIMIAISYVPQGLSSVIQNLYEKLTSHFAGKRA
jgi:branched-chain amino acid transport system permease protein